MTWISKSGLAVLLVGLSCSKAMPPKGPEYVPSQTEEAKTECPEERETAQLAREALLGNSDPGLVREAALQVFVHAQCEAQQLQTQEPPQGTHEQILTQLRTIRGQIQNAMNLFAEVRRYDDPGLSAQASLHEAKLKLGFAALVSTIRAPTDMDAAGHQAFVVELEDATQTLRQEAAALQRLAIDASANGAEHAEACRLLGELGTRHARCS
jgi:hypothetical protein